MQAQESGAMMDGEYIWFTEEDADKKAMEEANQEAQDGSRSLQSLSEIREAVMRLNHALGIEVVKKQ